MFISSLHVHRFRCINDATLTCQSLTALVGPNGCGKSTFLKALDLFFASDARLSEDDFYNRDTDADIAISVIFADVDPYYADVLVPYLHGEQVKVTRVFSWGQGRVIAKFHGYLERHPGFTPLRAAGGATQQKALYEQLRRGPLYQDLPPWTKQADLAGVLARWETDHPDHCSRQQDDGVFFGIGAGARFDLGRLVQPVFIPAVRDAAADATDMRGSPITELLDIAFRSEMADREDFRRLQADVQSRYGQIIEEARRSELQAVEQHLSQTMGTFVSSAHIKFAWREPEKIKLPAPSAEVLIVEDGYESPVGRTGHGIQRAFTLSLLQEMTAARVRHQATRAGLPEPEAPLPMLLLLIEEPELFQYPNRQRSIARTLEDLSRGSIPGVAERTQIIFGTHNPLFVSIGRAEQVRVLRKTLVQDAAPKATTVRHFDPQGFLEDLATCKDPGDQVGAWPYHRMKLMSIMTPEVNEGFFAKGIVLVEGAIDRAGIVAGCALRGLRLEDSGINVIQCRGKANLGRLALIFRQLGIDVFILWDGDAHKPAEAGECARRTRENRELCRLVGIPPDDMPITHIEDTFACVETDFEKQVTCDLAGFYPQFAQGARERYGIPAAEVFKHPVIFEELLREAEHAGHASQTLDTIVERIQTMATRLATF